MINRPGILYSCFPSCRKQSSNRRSLVKLPTYLVEDKRLGYDRVDREVCCSDLLSDTTCFALLHICLPDLHEDR